MALGERLPKVTVLLPVHNAEGYLREALGSVVAQTFADFEVLVVNDGSTDGSVALVTAFGDSRVRVLDVATRQGIGAALNRGLAEARGEYVARMDADDVCLPRRLERQTAFLDRHPDIGVCGCWVETFGAAPPRLFRRPTGPDVVRAATLFENPFVHASVMFRRPCFEGLDLRYDGDFDGAEDFDLWTRALQHTRGDNVAEVLLRYRQHAGSITGQSRPAMDRQMARVIGRQLRALGLKPTAGELDLHLRICRGVQPVDGAAAAYVRLAGQWLLAVRDANEHVGFCDPRALERVTAELWLRTCLAAARSGSRVLPAYVDSALRSGHSALLPDRLIVLAAVLRARLTRLLWR